MLRYCLSIYQFVLLVLIPTKKIFGSLEVYKITIWVVNETAQTYKETQTTQTVDQYRMNMLSIDRLYFVKVLVCQARCK